MRHILNTNSVHRKKSNKNKYANLKKKKLEMLNEMNHEHAKFTTLK